MINEKQKLIRSIAFGIINFLIPMIILLISIFAPSGQYETALIGLSTMCWLNTVALLHNTSNISATLPQELDRFACSTEAAIKSTFGPLCDDLTSFKHITHPVALSKLIEMSKLHNDLSRRDQFSQGSSPIIEYLIDHHMSIYVSALRSVAHDQSLPLPSEPRMKVAMSAIAQATTVLAISIANDEWHQSPRKYVDANVAAARSGVKIQRIFVVKKKGDFANFAEALHQQYHAGIELRLAVHNNLENAVAHLDVPLVNMLICDSNLLTCSTTKTKHDGRLMLNADQIARYKLFFENAWHHAEPYSPINNITE